MPLAFNQHFIRNKGNELTVGWLFVIAVHLDAKNCVDVFNLTTIPRDLDGVSDCTLYLAWAGAELISNTRIKFFGYAVNYFGLFNRKFDGLS